MTAAGGGGGGGGGMDEEEEGEVEEGRLRLDEWTDEEEEEEEGELENYQDEDELELEEQEHADGRGYATEGLEEEEEEAAEEQEGQEEDELEDEVDDDDEGNVGGAGAVDRYDSDDAVSRAGSSNAGAKQQQQRRQDDAAAAIADIFRCFICLGKAVDAQLCPCCSKICCSLCIRRWLTDEGHQHCPHCRASLRASQLVNCRFVAEVSAEIDRLQHEHDRQQQHHGQLCAKHGSSYTYFCGTCSAVICSDCAVFSEEHSGHKFERLSDVYERHVEAIQAEAAGLYRRLKELRTAVKTADENIERVQKGKDEHAAELQLAMESMQARLEAQLKGKLLTLLGQKMLEGILRELNSRLSTSSRAELVSTSSELVRALHAALQRQTATDFQRTPVSTEFESQVVPPYSYTEVSLHNFFAKLRPSAIVAHRRRSERDVDEEEEEDEGVDDDEDNNNDGGDATCSEVIYSDAICTGGIKWRLKASAAWMCAHKHNNGYRLITCISCRLQIYPNGNGVARGTHLSVFLEMLEGGGPEPARYEYRVVMLHRRRPSQCIVREFASEFEVGECWGYNRFFRIDQLVREGYLLPEEDIITLRFAVRAPLYSQQCKDQQRAIAKLQAEKQEALAQVAVLRRALVSDASTPSTSSAFPRKHHHHHPSADATAAAAVSSSSDRRESSTRWRQQQRRRHARHQQQRQRSPSSSRPLLLVPVVRSRHQLPTTEASVGSASTSTSGFFANGLEREVISLRGEDANACSPACKLVDDDVRNEVEDNTSSSSSVESLSEFASSMACDVHVDVASTQHATDALCAVLAEPTFEAGSAAGRGKENAARRRLFGSAELRLWGEFGEQLVSTSRVNSTTTRVSAPPTPRSRRRSVGHDLDDRGVWASSTSALVAEGITKAGSRN
eukprot:jgi/Chlat1/7969/Chrsp69S07398